ncbi:L-alanine exporter AlaE [Sansalvadorimonas sp. 2012CJ34-2]|uniref:L-alanine exporter AlaE n=1 Tax=Parendozoicomonas callyspongiae TaxID=2942213 RepID=A0ABT0PHI6_9GAMM|nr:L-alanine exporter AlaE [Sansalvadorimonas sp. 2012CJ34-2]MCL6270824.1 L-alanine exporter AlaE [Sansalvadorimonas sp. 2012CJ34-2]
MKLNRSWIADTVALISFTVVTGMFIEIAIVGMTLRQSIISRLMCQPLNISLGRVYGLYRDKIINKICGEKRTFLKETLGDILSYLSFQLPLYIGILIAVGMDMQGIIKASVTQTLALVILGAPYGRWLGFVRSMILNKNMTPA